MQIMPLMITFFVVIIIYLIMDRIKRERSFVSHLVKQNISSSILQHSFKLRIFGEKESLGDKIIASVSKKHTENLRTLYNVLPKTKAILLSAPQAMATTIIISINSKAYNNKLVVDNLKISITENQYFLWNDISDIYVNVNYDEEGIGYYYLNIILNASNYSEKESLQFLINDTEQNIILYELWMRAQLPKYKIFDT